ncbi:hypothetical protein R5R35_002478 [Gryllus longicercus]|uniref:Uncharacterized protein n=1 Tax=Gryllus longicercus TaxID=2509291 RepID=A0AAN9Z8D7_9ORTH
MEEVVSQKKRRKTGLFQQSPEYYDRYVEKPLYFSKTVREEADPSANHHESKSPKMLEFTMKMHEMQSKDRNKVFQKDNSCQEKMNFESKFRTVSGKQQSPSKVDNYSKSRIPFKKIQTFPRNHTVLPIEDATRTLRDIKLNSKH